MKKIEIDGKPYLLDVEEAAIQGILIKKGDKPYSWEEYKTGKHKNEYRSYNELNEHFDEFDTPIKAAAFAALGKLIQLRDAWIGKDKPDWNDIDQTKYTISVDRGKLYTGETYIEGHILAFTDETMRDEFYTVFHDLIWEAKNLL